jgi:hypothetical protein
MNRSYKSAVVALGAALVSLCASRVSSAAPLLMTTIDYQQALTIDGWNITVSPGVLLYVEYNSDTLLIDKTAIFESATEQIPITFATTDSNPLGTIDFVSEELSNDTGSTITAFTFSLLQTGTGSVGFAQTFTPPAGATENTVSSQEVTYSGLSAGVSGATNNPTLRLGTGLQSANNMVIDANTDFTLKEIAAASANTNTSPVPLPTAGVQSMLGLAGLGLFGVWISWNKGRRESGLKLI